MTTTARTLLTDTMRRRLVARRKDYRCSQKQLASMLRITNVHLCNLERGKNQPSFDLLLAWCTKLGMKVTVDIE